MMMPSFGSVSGAAEDVADPPHHARPRVEADRDVGAGRAGDGDQTRIVECEPVRVGEKPQRCGGIRRAAAEPGAGR